jgi:hypothetical protein
MSVFSQLKAPHVREVFNTGVVKPKGLPKVEILVPPQGYPQAVGVAIDYAVRFGLVGRGLGQPRRLTAESACRRAAQDPDLEPYRARMERTLREALGVLKARPLAGPELPTDAALALFSLTRLDPIYRAGAAFARSALDRETTVDDVRDLQALYRVVPWEELRPQRALLLNPTFGEGSVRVGGGDADLVLDDTMIELKTQKSPTIEKASINQLVAYALLANRFGCGSGAQPWKIEQLAVFLTRAGRVVRFPLKDCLKAPPETLLAALLDVRKDDDGSGDDDPPLGYDDGSS